MEACLSVAGLLAAVPSSVRRVAVARSLHFGPWDVTDTSPMIVQTALDLPKALANLPVGMLDEIRATEDVTAFLQTLIDLDSDMPLGACGGVCINRCCVPMLIIINTSRRNSSVATVDLNKLRWQVWDMLAAQTPPPLTKAA